MKYFITESERDSTCYHEWARGYFDGVSFWAKDSLLIDDDRHYQLGLEKIFQLFIPDYHPLGECTVTEKQWKSIMKKAVETGGELLACLQEADTWAKENFREYKVFTMIGM